MKTYKLTTDEELEARAEEDAIYNYERKRLLEADFEGISAEELEAELYPHGYDCECNSCDNSWN